MLGLFLEAIAMELFVEEATFHERAGSITQFIRDKYGFASSYGTLLASCSFLSMSAFELRSFQLSIDIFGFLCISPNPF